MDKKGYKEALDILINRVDNEDINDDIINKIEYMYDFKPVSTKWHLLNCKAMIKQGKYIEAINRYKDMISKEYIFENNIELWNLLIEAYSKSGDELESKRQTYMRSKLAQDNEHEEIDNSLVDVREKFMAGDESKENLLLLEDLYYQSCNMLMAYCIYLYAKIKYPEVWDDEKEKKYLNMDNMAYYSEYIQSKKEIILIMDKDSSGDYDILAYVLHALGVSVYMICDVLKEEGDYDLKDTLEISLENVADCEDCKLITAIEKINEGKSEGDNTSYIIDYICREITEDDFALVLASSDILEGLLSNPFISKRFERLNQYEAEYLENKVGFGWSGDYYTYISRIYNTDVRELVERETEYDFSIVIPVRNVTETLFYTVKTCLEQDYDGTYEVVISDNSTEGNLLAYEICQRFDDEKLKYYKTPRDLCLTKSFEYGYLQTKGEFIIPLGADDGILPWGLSALKFILNTDKFKEHSIIKWVRGFYAWPGFNGGQENQFVIPQFYEKNKIAIIEKDSKEYIKSVLSSSNAIYSLPNLYINSGFKRKYLHKLYEKTGGILNGSAQDIYTGLTNCSIIDKILEVQYPITMAGMSSSSVGAISNNITSKYNEKNNDKFKVLVSGKGICTHVQGKINNILPYFIPTDVSGLYKNIDKLIKKNVFGFKVDYEEDVVKYMYQNCYKNLEIYGDKYEKYILMGYEIIKKMGGSLVKWFEEQILEKCNMILYLTDECIKDNKAKKTYNEGYSNGGGVILDASRFDVENIYDATQLVKSFLNF